MVDIQPAAAEIRRGKKTEDDRKIEITGQKYNGPLLHRAAINRSFACFTTGKSFNYAVKVNCSCETGLHCQRFQTAQSSLKLMFAYNLPIYPHRPKQTRHRVNTNMYSLTFCVRGTTPPQYERNETAHAAGASILSPVRGVFATRRTHA